LYTRVIEADERVGAAGDVVRPLDAEALQRDLESAHAAGLRSVAIVFLHGYRHTAHELAAEALARETGFTQISVSHKVSPLMKLVSRGDTTVVDAYLSPILRRYVDQVAAEMPGVRLFFMQSSGGLADAHAFQGKDAILSGPAGGVVGMAETGRAAGFERLIGFDMGGTSTDVSHFDGEYERAFETEVAGVRMRAPMMLIHTVAAGGGSILHFDGARFRVGPDSAGANPGPKCYRRGGPLAVTDANVMLGKLIPDFFPKIFGPRQDQPLDAEAVRAAFTDLARQIGDGRGAEEVADGFIKIAVENMANAIKKISVQRGYDVTRYALNCFGGAGGQHACLVADALGMTKVLIHPFSSLLSAYGMGLASIRATRQQAIEEPFGDAALASLAALGEQLGEDARNEVIGQGVRAADISVHVRAHIRYAGTDTALVVPGFVIAGRAAATAVARGREAASPESRTSAETVDSGLRPAAGPGMTQKLKFAFEAAHKSRFGFIDESKAMVVEAVSVEAIGEAQPFSEPEARVAPGRLPAPRRQARFFSAGAWHDGRVYTRDQLAPGHRVDGPAIIIEPHQTIVVEHGWCAEITAKNHLILSRAIAMERQAAIGTEADPVMLEVFNNLFMSIAEQMGVSLQNTAYSVNIKERLDFSCAVFAADATLVANAPHMPVHLGSMDRAVETIIRENQGRIAPGDVYAINAPYNGGTHLPDITVCTPVFNDANTEILFWVASRGHHADIGGISPGSMSPHATVIDEEGVYMDNFKLVEGGRFRERATHELLTGANYPARNPVQNINDMKAQIAANEKGVQELNKMVAQFTLPVVKAYMQHVQDNAAESVRRVIDRLHDAEFSYEMDQGTLIKVKITVDKDKREATVDFTGTSPQQPTNFNAPEPVTRAAVLYVFRVMVDDDIPMNAGCLRPINIVIPQKSMLSPEWPAAVVAGNVETSQAVTNCLFGALGALAAAQGTMNNLNFGNAKYQYYETICSGSPAGPGFDGTDAVHTHMTNTRLTDPEVLEFRYPVLLEDFHIRKGSGGRGKWKAGDGIRRTIRFLEKMECTILSGHRRVRPFGLAGGEPGQVGENAVRRRDGRSEKLQGCDATVIDADEAVIIQTPTAGGYGDPKERAE
ncbi:MAG: hydantoinase B/oxoprolinase family protein, partial [Xanthobacteraceae bacterium]